MTVLLGKTILITGAGKGLGRLLALRLADLGSKLTLWDKDDEALRDLQSSLLEKGIIVQCTCLDLSDHRAVEHAGQSLLSEIDHVDVLINNAGIVFGKTVLELTSDDVELLFRVNAITPINIVRLVLPGMLRAGGGHIVNISSAAGMVGIPRLSVYSATKAALLSFDDGLRMELKSSGAPVRTTIICPFFIDTGMFTGVTSRFSWLLPILPKDYVADRIIAGLLSNAERIILPRFVYSVYLMRLLPVGLFDRLAKFFGLTESMRSFKESTSVLAKKGDA